MENDHSRSELMKRYLLGELADDDRSGVEREFLANDDAFDDINAIEDELFYDYAAGELTANQRRAFEMRFLNTREGRDKAAFAAAFIESSGEFAGVVDREPLREKSSGFFGSIMSLLSFGPAMQVGMAAAVILVAIGVVGLILKQYRTGPEIADINVQVEDQEKSRQESLANAEREKRALDEQIAAERDRNSDNDIRLKELEAERERLAKDVEAKRRVAEAKDKARVPGGNPTVATAVISPGLFTRDDGNPMNRIKIGPGTSSVGLTLLLKNVGEYSDFDIKMTAVDSGAAIASRSGIKAQGRKSSRSLNLSIPADRIARGDYEIELSGRTSAGVKEKVTRYYISFDR